MGIDSDIFVDQRYLDDFKCPICLDVFRNPIELLECRHKFCSRCIEMWISRYFILDFI